MAQSLAVSFYYQLACIVQCQVLRNDIEHDVEDRVIRMDLTARAYTDFLPLSMHKRVIHEHRAVVCKTRDSNFIYTRSSA